MSDKLYLFPKQELEFFDELKKAEKLLKEKDACTSSKLGDLFLSLIKTKEINAMLQKRLFRSFVTHDLKLEKKQKQQIKNIKSALNFLSGLEGKDLLKIQTIEKLHGIVQKNLGKKGIRKEQNWIGPLGEGIDQAYFFPPRAEDVLMHLRDIYGYFEASRKDPILKVAVFFAQFLIIHPFMDGNGRVARTFVPYLFKYLLKNEKSFVGLSSYFKKHRLEYFERLYQISTKKSFKKWVSFFIKGIVDEAKSELEVFQKLEKLDELMQELKISKAKKNQIFSRLYFIPKSIKEHLLLKALRKKNLILKSGDRYYLKELVDFIIS